MFLCQSQNSEVSKVVRSLTAVCDQVQINRKWPWALQNFITHNFPWRSYNCIHEHLAESDLCGDRLNSKHLANNSFLWLLSVMVLVFSVCVFVYYWVPGLKPIGLIAKWHKCISITWMQSTSFFSLSICYISLYNIRLNMCMATDGIKLIPCCGCVSRLEIRQELS